MTAAASASPSATPFADLPDEAAPTACPARFPAPTDDVAWVPEPPTTQTAGRLVPDDADPVEAVVCRYEVLTGGGSALVGSVRLRDGLDRLRLDLDLPAGKTPGDCVPDAGPQVPHLLRLSYADGDLWVPARQDEAACTGTGNGAFTSGTHLGDLLGEAYDRASWPPA